MTRITSNSVLQDVLDRYSHLDLTYDVFKEGRTQVGGGAFSDVYRSQLRPDRRLQADAVIQGLLDEIVAMARSTSSPLLVAVKQLRIWDIPNPKFDKAVAKELKIWAKLSHPNVLPMLGFVCSWSPSIYPSFVSPWMENGTLRRYMKDHTIDIPSMAEGIASGLAYLHLQGVVHSDLKCENVLLSPSLNPLLTDFGLSRQMIASESRSYSTTKDASGSLRWMAPEFFRDADPIKEANEETDVWAFGMALLELLTRDVPYGRSTDYQIMFNLAKCVTPVEPRGMRERPVRDQNIWEICQKCWNPDPAQRPTSQEISCMFAYSVAVDEPPSLIESKLYRVVPRQEFAYSVAADEPPSLIESNLYRVVPRQDLATSIPGIKVNPLIDGNTPQTNLRFDLSSFFFHAGFLAQSTDYSRYLNQTAIHPGTTRMTITCSAPAPNHDRNSWRIDMNLQRQISIRDVLDAVRRSLQTQITQDEWIALSQDQQTLAMNACARRSKEAFLPESQRDGGIRRVDLLGERYIFGGLVPQSENDGIHFSLVVYAKRNERSASSS